jgi:hypothetical protein
VKRLRRVFQREAGVISVIEKARAAVMRGSSPEAT